MSSSLRSSFRRSRRLQKRTSSLANNGVLVRYALRTGTVDSVKHFFSGKLQANVDHPLPDGQLPLHVAVDANREDVVLFLLDQGADINNTDPSEWTALHRAVYNGHIPLVRLLLEHGADATRKAGHLLPSDLAMSCDANMCQLLQRSKASEADGAKDENSNNDVSEQEKSEGLTPPESGNLPARSFSFRRSFRKHTSSLFKGVTKRGGSFRRR